MNKDQFLQEYVYDNFKHLDEEKREQSRYYETEKFPSRYDFNGFLDSDGTILNEGDASKIGVGYESVLFCNFLGWQNSTESNQLSLFSELFTDTKHTCQSYDKKGHTIFYEFNGCNMYQRPFEDLHDLTFDCVVGRASQTDIHFSRFKKESSFYITVQALMTNPKKGVVLDNSYFVKVPPPFLTKYFIENFEKFERKPLLIYPATVNDDSDKNQRGFSKLLDSDAVKDHIIVFCGNITNKSYQQETERILNSKNIDHVFLGQVPHYLLKHLYLISKASILYSRMDYGPRALVESTWAGLPFVTNSRVHMPDQYLQFGKSCKDGNSLELNDELSNLLNYSEHKNIHTYCKENLTLFKVYSRLFEDISDEYKKYKEE